MEKALYLFSSVILSSGRNIISKKTALLFSGKSSFFLSQALLFGAAAILLFACNYDLWCDIRFAACFVTMGVYHSSKTWRNLNLHGNIFLGLHFTNSVRHRLLGRKTFGAELFGNSACGYGGSRFGKEKRRKRKNNGFVSVLYPCCNAVLGRSRYNAEASSDLIGVGRKNGIFVYCLSACVHIFYGGIFALQGKNFG